MKRILAAGLLVLVLIVSVDAAGDRSPIGLDAFMRIKRLSDPRVSPSGKTLTFVVTEMDLEGNRSLSDIWIISTTGGEPVRLTTSPAADYNPRWSPDGKTIAFLSTRDGDAQIWKISPYGGEATRLSSVPGGVSGFAWSPQGDRIALASSVVMGTPHAESEGDTRAKIFNHLLYRHWNTWRDGKRSHVFILPAGGGKPRDVTPGDFDAPPVSLGGRQDYVFSPDGDEVCFVRNEDPDLRLGLGTNNDLFLTSAQGGNIRRITENRANDNSPVYSPDGKWIAYRAMARPGFEADRYRLILYDRSTGEKRDLTPSLDRSVGEFLWSPDSRSLFFTFEEQGRDVLARLSLVSRKTERLLEGHTLGSLQVSPDGKTVYFLEQASDRPAEIHALDRETGALRLLTRFNAPLLSRLEMNELESFWFPGAGGEKVHGFLLKPPFFDPAKKYPLVMLIHGGPQGAWKDQFHYRWNAQMFASPGYAVAMINFHGSTGYGQAFTDSISGDWGGKPYQDIMKGLDHLLSRFPFLDAKKVGAAGASYGGYMIDWIEGHTDRFACLISHAGVFDLRSMYGATEELWFPEWEFRGTPWTNREMYERWSPSAFVQNFRTPCLVIHGQLDFRVPVTQGFQLFTALQRMRIPSKMIYFPDEGHFVLKPRNARLWWENVLAWLESYLR